MYKELITVPGFKCCYHVLKVARHFKAIDEQRATMRPEVKETYNLEYMRNQIHTIVHYKVELVGLSFEWGDILWVLKPLEYLL